MQQIWQQQPDQILINLQKRLQQAAGRYIAQRRIDRRVVIAVSSKDVTCDRIEACICSDCVSFSYCAGQHAKAVE